MRKDLIIAVHISTCRWLQLILGRVQWLGRWTIPGCPSLMAIWHLKPQVKLLVWECVALLPHSCNHTWRLRLQLRWTYAHIMGCVAQVSTHPDPGTPTTVTCKMCEHVAASCVMIHSSLTKTKCSWAPTERCSSPVELVLVGRSMTFLGSSRIFRVHPCIVDAGSMN